MTSTAHPQFKIRLGFRHWRLPAFLRDHFEVLAEFGVNAVFRLAIDDVVGSCERHSRRIEV